MSVPYGGMQSNSQKHFNKMALLCVKLQSACPLLLLPLRGDLQQ